jgi:hypothetical protein
MPQKKKKRKKKAGGQQQKINRNHQRNKFLESFRHISGLLDCSELYDKIPGKEMDMFCMIHFGSIRVEADAGQKISARLIKFYNWFINNWLKEMTIELYQDGPSISLYDYFTIIYTFTHYSPVIEKSYAFKVITEIMHVMEQQINLNELSNQAWSRLNPMLVVASLFRSNLLTSIYFFDIDILQCKVGTTHSIMKVLVSKKQVDTLSVRLKGKQRTVYRMGFPMTFGVFNWIQFDAKTLKMSSMDSKQLFDVYTQAHALERLYERCDCFSPARLHSGLFLSLGSPEIFVMSENKRLIEYKLNEGEKLGYLVGEVVNNLVIIRTFLLLTQEDTPEGERLKSIMSSSKEDAKYWALDRLSTFVASDIHENESLKRIFVQAGCGGLFEVKTNEDALQRTIEQADAMVKYFGLDEEEGTMARQHEGTRAQKND